MNYSWDFYGAIKNVFHNGYPVSSLTSTHEAEYLNIPVGKHKLRFTTNHDESAWDATPVKLFNGKNGALAASVATIYLGGIPLIYGSQEVGVSSNISFFYNTPINWSLNPDMLKTYKELLSSYSMSDVLKRGKLQIFDDSNFCQQIHVLRTKKQSAPPTRKRLKTQSRAGKTS